MKSLATENKDEDGFYDDYYYHSIDSVDYSYKNDKGKYIKMNDSDDYVEEVDEDITKVRKGNDDHENDYTHYCYHEEEGNEDIKQATERVNVSETGVDGVQDD